MTDLTVDSFVRLESEVWEALVRGDPEADTVLLSQDFLGVYPSGFLDRSEHAAQLNVGPSAAGFALSEARIRVLSDDDHVLLSYRADWQPVRGGEICGAETMYISSLWSRVEGAWLNVFSQDTPAAASG